MFKYPPKSENEDFREQENEKSKRKSQKETEKSNWADFTFTGSGRIKLNDSNSTGTEYFWWSTVFDVVVYYVHKV